MGEARAHLGNLKSLAPHLTERELVARSAATRLTRRAFATVASSS